jgi:hypothetical protein
MIRTRNKPKQWRPKPKPGTPGGEYNFTWRGKAYSLPGKFVQDAESASDDGLRWIAAKESKSIIAGLVCQIADDYCELHEAKGCWGKVPRFVGHPHHVRHKKMGGAQTDDRIWIAVDGDWVRIRVLACPTCHAQHHGEPRWSQKEAA